MYRVIMIDDEPWSMVDINASVDFAALDMDVVAEYHDSITALVAITKEAPDVIITDIRMPYLDGLDLIRRIRDNDIQSEIVIISGFQDFKIAQKAMELDVCGYCLKPIDPQELTQLLTRAADRLSQKQEVARANHEPTDADTDAFDRLTAYMKLNYPKKLQLGALAEQFFLSPNYCSYLFAKRKNTTFSHYLQAIRIGAAKELLSQTNRPMAEVAELVGYQDYFYFSRVFKAETSQSPKDFRRVALAARRDKDGE